MVKSFRLAAWQNIDFFKKFLSDIYQNHYRRYLCQNVEVFFHVSLSFLFKRALSSKPIIDPCFVLKSINLSMDYKWMNSIEKYIFFYIWNSATWTHLIPSNPSSELLMVKIGARAYALATRRLPSKTISFAQISSSIWFHLSSTSWICSWKQKYRAKKKWHKLIIAYKWRNQYWQQQQQQISIISVFRRHFPCEISLPDFLQLLFDHIFVVTIQNWWSIQKLIKWIMNGH